MRVVRGWLDGWWMPILILVREFGRRVEDRAFDGILHLVSNFFFSKRLKSWWPVSGYWER